MRHRPIVVLLLVYTGDAFAAGGCPKDGVRWASTSNRIYVTGEVECTLPDLREALPAEVPLTEVEEGVWYLGANVFLEQGATLAVDGSSHGGTVDELRLKSDGSGFVELRAEWGNLYLRGTHVTSWDEREGGPDTDHEGGRAFIRAVSFLDGATPRQSRMDVIDSEIAYLGYYAAESYGLSWKVRDPSPDVFEKVDVLGDITNSRIHHNYFGMYSYGAYGMRITGSEFHDNVMYGIDPHDDSDGLLVEGNYTHDNGNHGFICSKRCDGLTVRGNTSSNNAGVGYMFHRAVENSVLEDNLAENNVDAGFAIMDSHKNIVRRNVARGNKYGLRYSVGASENVAEDNDLSGNTMYGIYMYQGTDAPTINDGCPQDNVFQRNDATSNGILGMRASCAKGNTFAENLFGDNASYAVFLFDSPDNVFSANDLGGSYIHVQGDSETHLRDTDTAGVLLGDDSASVRLGDTRGRVFEVGPGVVTRVG
ncbi:MAG: nitrous oxide reductase family maturation protein NosD, partial [Myxococcota bacterium]